jgi:DNA-binding NtrC family response regulator
MPWAEEQTDQLARRLKGIADAGMRSAYLRFTLLNMTAVDVADLFVVAHAYAEAKHPRHQNLLAALSMAMAHESCVQLRQAVSAVLRSREQPSLARSLSQERTAEEEDALRRTLAECCGKQAAAARALGIPRSTLRDRLRSSTD